MKLEAGYFEDLYRRHPDPWGFESSEYEAGKYAHTLAALDGRRFARALELGCSIGVFTELLAERCDALRALDAAPSAVARARERLASRPWVGVEQRTLPEELPEGPFDLVVCSEILYYWSEDVLVEALGRLEAALAPGGSLIAVHWRPATRTYPLQGDEVHAIMRRELGGLVLGAEHVEDRYRLERFDRPR